MADVGEQTQQQMTNAWMAKVDAMFEEMQKGVRREQEQWNDWHTYTMEGARQNQQIVNRLAQDGASVSAAVNGAMALGSARGNDAAAAFQNLVMAAALGQQITANKMSAEVASADVIAKKAVDAATAAMTGTSAASQGTTGVAQGSLQAGTSVATVDLITQVSKLAGAIDVLLLKVAALEAAGQKPAA